MPNKFMTLAEVEAVAERISREQLEAHGCFTDDNFRLLKEQVHLWLVGPLRREKVEE
jgi:hypothetical protein